MPCIKLLPLFAIAAVLCAIWSVLAGKDVNWDMLNYHYYVPYEWLHGRLGQDYFAASAQSYLNPVGYLPFYAMVSAGWHSVLASMALAAFHGTAIGFLYLIAWRLFEHRPLAERRLLAVLAAALGACTAVFWTTVGGSFLEPLLVVPMLAGLALLLDPASPRWQRRTFAAGLLFGLATALKYYNAIFALAALPLVLAAPRASVRQGLHAGLAYAAGGIAALALFAGPWMALMWREFGNPVFPLLNGWFQSPDAPPANVFAGRFALSGLGEALAFPFLLAVPAWMRYAEISAPDLRFAALAFAAVALPVFTRTWPCPSASAALRAPDWRLLAFFFLSFVLWLFTSANGRYGMLVLLLAGLCLARLAERLLPLPAARIALLVLLIAQVAACLLASASRWYLADRWSSAWLPFVVAERAKQEPALYFSVETLPMAAVVPFIHPASSFVNLRGQYSIAPGAPRVQALIHRHAGRVRVFGRYLRFDQHGKPFAQVVEVYDRTLVRHGYRIDPSDCFGIAWQPDESDVLSRAANWLAGQPEPHDMALSLGSCGLQTAERDPEDVASERRVSAAFDRIESRCGALLRGQRALTEPMGKEWLRNYPALDARLLTERDRVILERYLALAYIDLGPLSNWQQEPAALPAACAGAGKN
jgi:hypothetical protein